MSELLLTSLNTTSVINILRKWVSLHYYDFEENRDLLRSLLQFTSEELAVDHPVSASRLILAIQEKEPDSLLEKLNKSKPSPELVCEAMKKPSSRLLGDRTSFLKKYKNCFVGAGVFSFIVLLMIICTSPLLYRHGGSELGVQDLSDACQ